MRLDLRLDLPDITQQAWDLLGQVPPGRVTTFGDMGVALGDRIAARWLGHLALHHEHHAACPCHRAVRSDGGLGGYIAGGAAAKAERLAAEGIGIAGGRVDLDRHRFADFESDRPLERLCQAQDRHVERLCFRPWNCLPEFVGGVDVSYLGPDAGVAAYALVELATGRLAWSATIRAAVRFPYIASYLSFRELPLLIELLEHVRAEGRLAEVVLVDGTGVLHPRRMGIAAHLGIVADVPTVGIAKKLLCGHVATGSDLGGPWRMVVHAGETIGAAILPTPEATKPLYVSPGQGVDVDSCRRLVERTLRGHRLPEPLYWADRLSRAEARRLIGPSVKLRQEPRGCNDSRPLVPLERQ